MRSSVDTPEDRAQKIREGYPTVRRTDRGTSEADYVSLEYAVKRIADSYEIEKDEAEKMLRACAVTTVGYHYELVP